MDKKQKRLAHHVDKRIRTRFRIFALLSLIFFVILIRDLYTGSISFILFIIALVVGIGVGIIASRSNRLSWDHDGKKVVGRMDTIGAVVLGFYILFAIFRRTLIGIFVHGPMLGTVTVAVLAGIFIGQIIGVRNGVRGILRDEGILK